MQSQFIMFKIIEMCRRICIPCKYFHKDADLNKIIVLMVNKFMHNKVIYNVGLFIILTSVDHVKVFPTIMNKSDIFISVRFQCLVFTLVEGEALLGTINECTPQGLSINLKFFQSITVDSHYLPTPSKYENNKKRWIWNKKIGINEYYFTMNSNDDVYFKVLETKYNRLNMINKEMSIEPMITNATLKQELLGPIVWWE